MCGDLFRMCPSRVQMNIFMGDCMLCCDKYLNTCFFLLIKTQSIGMLLYVSCVAVHRVSD